MSAESARRSQRRAALLYELPRKRSAERREESRCQDAGEVIASPGERMSGGPINQVVLEITRNMPWQAYDAREVCRQHKNCQALYDTCPGKPRLKVLFRPFALNNESFAPEFSKKRQTGQGKILISSTYKYITKSVEYCLLHALR